MQQSGEQVGDVKKSIYHASLLLMASILISRIIGFFREWVLAQAVGANAATDVYYASFTIPDVLNHLMAAGALSISFIPILSAYLTSGREEMARTVFRFVSTIMSVVLIGLILLAELFAPELARVVAPGFSPDQMVLLTFLIRIILPAQLFFYWGGLAVSVQNTHGKFFVPAIAPIVYNAAIIIFGLLLRKSHGVVGFSIGVLVGSFVGHVLLQWWGVHRLGYSILPFWRADHEIWAAFRRYLWLTIPIMFGFSIVVSDEWIGKYFASYLPGSAVSWLQYARIEMRIPVAIIGQAAGIASFPYLARLWSAGSYEDYGKTLLREVSKIWAFSLVAAVIFVSHAHPVTRFIYGGGKLTPSDLSITANVLKYFGIGIFFQTVQLLLSRGFYACQRTWLPSLVGTGVSVVSVALYWYVGNLLGVRGLALAGSIAFGAYALLLWILLRAHLLKACPSLSFKRFYAFCLLWLVLMVGLWLIAQWMLSWGVYQNTRLTAFADIILVTLILTTISVALLRTVFRKLTGDPLF